MKKYKKTVWLKIRFNFSSFLRQVARLLNRVIMKSSCFENVIISIQFVQIIQILPQAKRVQKNRRGVVSTRQRRS